MSNPSRSTPRFLNTRFNLTSRRIISTSYEFQMNLNTTSAFARCLICLYTYYYVYSSKWLTLSSLAPKSEECHDNCVAFVYFNWSLAQAQCLQTFRDATILFAPPASYFLESAIIRIYWTVFTRSGQWGMCRPMREHHCYSLSNQRAAITHAAQHYHPPALLCCVTARVQRK